MVTIVNASFSLHFSTPSTLKLCLSYITIQPYVGCDAQFCCLPIEKWIKMKWFSVFDCLGVALWAEVSTKMNPEALLLMQVVSHENSVLKFRRLNVDRQSVWSSCQLADRIYTHHVMKTVPYGWCWRILMPHSYSFSANSYKFLNLSGLCTQVYPTLSPSFSCFLCMHLSLQCCCEIVWDCRQPNRLFISVTSLWLVPSKAVYSC